VTTSAALLTYAHSYSNQLCVGTDRTRQAERDADCQSFRQATADRQMVQVSLQLISP